MPTDGRVARSLPVWLVPVGLFVLALVLRAIAAASIDASPSEVSAYYVGVAGNLVAGRGLVSDAIWSYAAQPLSHPQPAFALWMPLASLLAAVPLVLGASPLAGAQSSAVLIGAAIAPLTWYVARDATGREGLSGRRAATVALGCGLVAACLGPFLVAVGAPDSTTAFTVLAVAACCAMPLALRHPGKAAWGIALGVLLGLTWLTRQEAVWLGLAYLLLLVPALRQVGSAERRSWLVRALALPVAAGALTIVPWLLRNLVVFGTPFPGQATDNLWFTRNSDAFAYLDRPGPADFLAQGPLTIVAHIGTGLGHQLLNVLLLPALPIGLVGLLSLVWLWRAPAVREAGALQATLVAGGLIFVATGVLFPVATLWGTFQHASGPLLVALIVVAGLGLDRLVAAVGRWRAWDKANAWLAPLLVLALVVPLAGLEVALSAGFAEREQARVAAASTALAATLPADASANGVIISDHPIWLAQASGRPTVVLPDEPPEAILQLARDFDARAVLIFGDRPESTPDLHDQRCFQERALPAEVGPDARLYVLAGGCLS